MRYEYWTVRYVPDPIRGEYVNVGVIAGSGDQWSFRRVSSLRRASRFGGSAAATEPFLERIESAIDARLQPVQTLLDEDNGRRFGKGEVDDLRVRLNNIVQLSEARPVVAASAAEAVDLAFRLMVVDDDEDVRHRSRTRVVHQLRDAFELRPRLVRHVWRFGAAKVGSQVTGVDFAVERDGIRQMSQVWSFEVKNVRNLQTQIQAWNYMMGLVRDDGGTLVSKTGRPDAHIAKNVPINAVYIPPHSNDGRKQFEIAKEGWAGLGVHSIPADNYGTVVEEAERLVLWR